MATKAKSYFGNEYRGVVIKVCDADIGQILSELVLCMHPVILGVKLDLQHFPNEALLSQAEFFHEISRDIIGRLFQTDIFTFSKLSVKSLCQLFMKNFFVLRALIK